MPDLITITDSKGLVGSCGRNCYEGKELTAICICLGSNHGIGLKAAALNTAINYQRWADRIRDRSHADRAVRVRIHPDILDFVLNPKPSHTDEA